MQPRANHGRLVVGNEAMVPGGSVSPQLIDARFRCLEKLQPAYQVTFPGQEPIVKKGTICPIDITLAQRASNKKVIFKKTQCLKMVSLMWLEVFRLSSTTTKVIYEIPMFV